MRSQIIRLSLWGLIALVIFVICFVVVGNVGAQFVNIVPQTGATVTTYVVIISALMTLIAIQMLSKALRGR